MVAPQAMTDEFRTYMIWQILSGILNLSTMCQTTDQTNKSFDRASIREVHIILHQLSTLRLIPAWIRQALVYGRALNPRRYE